MSSLSTSRGVRCTVGLRSRGSYQRWGRPLPSRDGHPRGPVAGSIIAAMRFQHPFAIALAAGLAAACGSSEPAKPAPAAQPAAAPAPPPKLRVYVTNEWSGDLTVIDAETQSAIGTYKLGKRPRGIQASPDGKSLYVALSGSPAPPPGAATKAVPPPDRAPAGPGGSGAHTTQIKG